jgi:hypothetical protein
VLSWVTLFEELGIGEKFAGKEEWTEELKLFGDEVFKKEQISVRACVHERMFHLENLILSPQITKWLISSSR